MAIKDTNGGIFGVFSNEPWKPHFGHYGTGECFLWKVDRVPIESEEKFIEIIKYAPTGQDSQFMISEVDFLASGCSDGRFGLWIDAQLLRGHSLPVSTFQNEPLSCTDEFELAGVEVWGLAVPDGSRRFS